MKARHKDTGEIIELAEEGIISRDGRRFCWYQVELIPEPIDECKPSLPSNLDEAALKELQVYLPQGNGPDKICYFIAPQMLAMYKAGAEWMAGRGETKEGEVLDRDEFIKFSDGTYIDLDPTLGLIPAFKLKDGDKVVVQIRKK